MPKEWDWYSDENKESIVVPSVSAVAVYTNNHGDIVLRQQDSMGEEDSVIILPRSLAATVVQAITNELKD